MNSPTATRMSRPSSRPRNRGRILMRGASEVTRTPAATLTSVPCRSRARSCARAFEPEARLADLDLVAERDRREPVDLAAVHVRAVGRAEVLDVPGAASIREGG